MGSLERKGGAARTQGRFWPASAGLAALLFGAFFYLVVRGYLASSRLSFTAQSIAPWTWRGLAWGSTPSLLHGFAFTCFAVAAGQPRKSALLFWLLMGSAWELCQLHFPMLGTYDSADLAANTLGVFLAYVLSGLSVSNDLKTKAFPTLRVPILAIGLLTCLATSKKNNGGPPILTLPTHEPVYMTYEDLRKSFAIESPRSMVQTGKVLAIGQTLFVTELNQGIHVIDNADPTHPKPILFLKLPGNLDIAAKDGVLFADSFIDLVAIQLDGEKPTEISRIKDTIPWNAYQATGNFLIQYDPASLDPKKGVVIGAREIDKNLVKKSKESHDK